LDSSSLTTIDLKAPECPLELVCSTQATLCSENITISPFSVSGAHGHWVGSTDTPSHSTKELEMR